MANPNIVSVTSIYGESLGQALTTTVTAVSATNKWCPSDPPAMVATLTMLGFAIGIFP